jgi:hypothetical protein
MVYKVKGGFKVKSKSGHAFSKKPLSKAKAQAQLRAIEMSKHAKDKKKKK